MYATAKVKTYQPILDTSKGPICKSPEVAFYDIILDLNEHAKGVLNEDEVEMMADNMSKLLGIEDWTDGVYLVVDEIYQIKVHTYQQGQLDEMREFEGY